MTTDETISGWFVVMSAGQETFVEAAAVIGVVKTSFPGSCRLLLIGGHAIESVAASPDDIMALIKRCRGPQSISG